MNQNLRRLFARLLLAVLLAGIRCAALAEAPVSEASAQMAYTVEDLFGADLETVNRVLHSLMDDFGGPKNYYEFVTTKWPKSSEAEMPVWDDFRPEQPLAHPRISLAAYVISGEEDSEITLQWILTPLLDTETDWDISILHGDQSWELTYIEPYYVSEPFPEEAYGLDEITFSRHVADNIQYTVCVDRTNSSSFCAVSWQDEQYRMEWHWIDRIGVNTLRFEWKENDQALLAVFDAPSGELIFSADGTKQQMDESEERIIGRFLNITNGSEE